MLPTRFFPAVVLIGWVIQLLVVHRLLNRFSAIIFLLLAIVKIGWRFSVKFFCGWVTSSTKCGSSQGKLSTCTFQDSNALFHVCFQVIYPDRFGFSVHNCSALEQGTFPNIRWSLASKCWKISSSKPVGQVRVAKDRIDSSFYVFCWWLRSILCFARMLLWGMLNYSTQEKG